MVRWVGSAVLAAALLGACTEPAPEVPPVSPVMRRLTTEQVQHLIVDVFGADLVLPQRLEPDAAVGGLKAVGASYGTVSSRGVEQYEDAAFLVAEQAVASEVWWSSAVDCDAGAAVEADCVRQMVDSTGRLLWRRSLSDDEKARVTDVAVRAGEVLGTNADAVIYAIVALMQSPKFLYRIESGSQRGGVGHFTDVELASRLSFLIWSSGPDESLLSSAEAGALATPEGIRAEAERMLADPRARRGIRAFMDDLLELDGLLDLNLDPTVFEHMSSELGPSAREETLALTAHHVLDLDAPWPDIMTTRTTVIDRRLAALYDVPAPALDGFALTELPIDGPRMGLLGHASTLAGHARPVGTSPTHRGIFVRQNLMCVPLPPPPAGVDTSIPEPSGDAPTMRDRVAEHLADPTCAGCHNIVDPIGLGLEKFDGVGRYRETDNGAEIDATGVLDGQPFLGAETLAFAVADHEYVPRCLVERMHMVATGREVDRGEELALEYLERRFEEQNYSVQALILDLVSSDSFRLVGALNETLPNEESP